MAKKKVRSELVTRDERSLPALFDDMDHYFSNFFRQPFSMMGHPFFKGMEMPGDITTPLMDLYEEGNELVVKAELPGIAKEDLTVTVSGNTLTVSGEKKQEEKVEKKDYHRIERSYGSFCRSMRLPKEVDDNKVKASFNNGILEVRLSTTKKAKQKKITIK